MSARSVIKSRRSIYPSMYKPERIPDSRIREALEMAGYAPTHRMTQPWRFKVIKGKGLEKLGQYLGEHYLRKTPGSSPSDIKYRKIVNKPVQSSHVIMICMKRDAQERVPEWEEISAVAMAVQNIWLVLTEMGVGAYWSTPGSMTREQQFLSLPEGEKCLGIMYVGVPKDIPPMPPREDMNSKIDWIEA